MKKIFILLLLIILSGCSVNYNLEFSGNTFSEEIKVGKFNKKDIPDFDYFEFYSIENMGKQKFYNIDYFNKYLKLDYIYDYDEFRLSNAFNSCYDNSSVTYDDKYYYIVTSDEFKCLEFMGYTTDQVNINFITDYLVMESNADYIDGKKHTWVINESNYNDKKIKIKIHKNKYYKNTFWDNFKEGKYFNTFTVSLGIIIVGFLGYLFFRWYSKVKNKI